MTIIEDPETKPGWLSRPFRVGLTVGIVITALIVVAVVAFLAHRTVTGSGKPETLVFTQVGEASGGPVTTPDCTDLVGQRITAVAVAVGCKVNGVTVDIPSSRCADHAAWYAIPDGTNVVFGKGGGSWQIADQLTYLTDMANAC